MTAIGTVFTHEGLTMKVMLESQPEMKNYKGTIFIKAWYKHDNGTEGMRWRAIHSYETTETNLLEAKNILLDGLPKGA